MAVRVQARTHARTAHSRQETVLQQPTGGTPRPDADSTDRDQAPANPPIQRLSGRASRALRDRVRSRVAAVGDVLRTALRPFTSAERALPIAVASIVAVAALLAFLPTMPQGAVSGIQGSASTNPRLAVNGGISRDQQLASALGALNAAEGGSGNKVAASTPDPSFESLVIPNEIAVVAPTTGPEPTTGPLANIAAPQPSTGPAATPVAESALFDDGTLIVGPAPDTRVEDGSDLVRSYTVQKGDTVRSVAKKFGVSSMTLWWANKLKKSSLKVGAEIKIPPVSGLVYTVKDTDTLDTVAKRFKIDSAKVVALNGLEDPTLVVGQVLILPGAKGPPKPTPKPTPKPSSSVKVAGGGGVISGGPAKYSGGSMRWPVIGGDNYISQYFHYGHYAIDIAADYGAKVVSSAPGKVIFAGWKSNGGGYQVWIAHGSGLYTTYNHMSAITVSRGENVSRGEQVGRIGASGMATGPHLHFEVWSGRVWDGGTRVNPLKYF
jgi:murein DD-endopeptidase MepM/ murein hydrolase activator NlpD